MASSGPDIATNATSAFLLQTPFLISTLLLPKRQMANKDINVCPLHLKHIISCNVLDEILCRFKAGQLPDIVSRNTKPPTVTKGLAPAHHPTAEWEVQTNSLLIK